MFIYINRQQICGGVELIDAFRHCTLRRQPHFNHEPHVGSDPVPGFQFFDVEYGATQLVSSRGVRKVHLVSRDRQSFSVEAR